jgi:hypothetical protein
LDAIEIFFGRDLGTQKKSLLQPSTSRGVAHFQCLEGRGTAPMIGVKKQLG